MVRRRVLVSGRVQGVGFRESCRRQAAALGLAGYVRNLAGGEVEAVFEGDAQAVARLVAWCGSGPPAAVVAAIEVREEPPVGEPPFEVR